MKLTRDKLKQIIKEELEEMTSKSFRQFQKDWGVPSVPDRARVTVKQKPTSTVHPLATKLHSIASSLNQKNSDDGPKVMSLGNLISSVKDNQISLARLDKKRIPDLQSVLQAVGEQLTPEEKKEIETIYSSVPDAQPDLRESLLRYLRKK
jgi:hypothetical protein